MSEPSQRDCRPEPAEDQADHPHVLGHAALDPQLAAGHAGQRHERGDLDVVGRDGVLAAAELRHPVDVHDVRADALDRRAHLVEHAREVLHVRLGGGVADHGRALGQRGGHQRVLGAHHGRLVHEEVGRAQAAVGRAHADLAVVLDLGAERAEGVEVRIEAAAADHVAARRRHQRAAEAGEQRPGDEERRADALGERGIDVRGRDVGGLQRDLVVPQPLDGHAEIREQGEHRLGVADARHVRDLDPLLGEEAGGEQRQCSVLVSGGHDGAGKRHAALDDELFHGRAAG